MAKHNRLYHQSWEIVPTEYIDPAKHTVAIYKPGDFLDPEAWYVIRANHSGKVLDVEGGPPGLAHGSFLQQFDYLGYANQKFRFQWVGDGFEIIAKHSGLCLDVQGGPSAVNENESKIQQFEYLNTDNQKWEVKTDSHGPSDNSIEIVAKNTSKCLEVGQSEFAKHNGVKVELYDWQGRSNQKWTLEKLPISDVDVPWVVKRDPPPPPPGSSSTTLSNDPKTFISAFSETKMTSGINSATYTITAKNSHPSKTIKFTVRFYFFTGASTSGNPQDIQGTLGPGQSAPISYGYVSASANQAFDRVVSATFQ